MLKQALPLACALVFAGIARAEIEPNAPSLSHHLEELSAEMHDYTHAVYGPSFGSHGLEVASGALHDSLHDWADGNATEAEVLADWLATKAAYQSFRNTISRARILNKGDDALDQLYDDLKNAYKDVRYALRNVNNGQSTSTFAGVGGDATGNQTGSTMVGIRRVVGGIRRF